jgi:hypothetical protein
VRSSRRTARRSAAAERSDRQPYFALAFVSVAVGSSGRSRNDTLNGALAPGARVDGVTACVVAFATFANEFISQTSATALDALVGDVFFTWPLTFQVSDAGDDAVTPLVESVRVAVVAAADVTWNSTDA